MEYLLPDDSVNKEDASDPAKNIIGIGSRTYIITAKP